VAEHADPGPGRRAPGELEAKVLAVLQASARPLMAAAVQERLGGDLAYSTVVTILSRLHAKGVLTRTRLGRAFAYAPVADQPGLAARKMSQVLDGEDDRQAVLARFVSTLSGQDEELIRALIGTPPQRPTGSG
jgi:predicted transcriptional regulator